MMLSLHSIPDHGSFWAYAADRELSEAEQLRFAEHFDGFTRRWLAHGDPVFSTYGWEGNRILIIAAHVPDGAVSGCSIDGLTDQLDEIARDLGFGWLPSLTAFIRTPEGIRPITRPDLKRQLREGLLPWSTPVFDLSVSTVGDYRSGAFERPAHESWVSRLPGMTVPAQ